MSTSTIFGNKGPRDRTSPEQPLAMNTPRFPSEETKFLEARRAAPGCDIRLLPAGSGYDVHGYPGKTTLHISEASKFIEACTQEGHTVGVLDWWYPKHNERGKLILVAKIPAQNKAEDFA